MVQVQMLNHFFQTTLDISKFIPQVIKIESETPAYFSWFSDDFGCLSGFNARSLFLKIFGDEQHMNH